MLSKTFGIVLRDFRKESKLSQEKLAELAGHDRSFISLLERGIKQPTLKTIFDLSKALKMTPSSLIKAVEDYKVDRRP